MAAVDEYRFCDQTTRDLAGEDLDIKKSYFDVTSNDGVEGDIDERERINSPLRVLAPADLERVAKRLALYYRVADSVEVFKKAAKVLAVTNLDDVPELSEHERQVLSDERKTGFWGQPWPLQTTFFVLFVAATVQGWNQTGTTGANLGWPIDLLYDGTTDAALLEGHLNHNCVPGGYDTWIFAAVNAMPYLAASIGTFLSDALNEVFFGRRNAILFSAILILASAIGSAFVQDWKVLLGLRALLGIGMGCKAAVVPVFAAEIAPAHLRGTLVMNWQVFDALGIFLGYSANLIVSRTANPWRWQLASSCIPTFALIWGVIFVQWDSPRFLIKHEENNREKHNDLMDLWCEQQRHDPDAAVPNDQDRAPGTSNNQERESAHNSTYQVSSNTAAHDRRNQARTHRLITAPDWLYLAAPRWLRKNVRPSCAQTYRSLAYKTLLILRGEPILAAKELIFAHCQLLAEIYTYPSEQSSELHAMQNSRSAMGANTAADTDIRPAPDANERRIEPQDRVNFSIAERTRWWDRVSHVQDKSMRYLTREALAACVVMIAQQLCGINVLIFYSATIFSRTEDSCSESLRPLLLCWGIGLTNLVFAFPAYLWIETMGRKWLMLATLPFLSILIAAASGSFAARQENLQQALLALFVYGFTAMYSFGMGPVPFTYTAEIFPLEHRIIGMSLGVSVNFLGAGILAFFVPIVSNGSILLAIFAGLNILAFTSVWMFVPETMGAAIGGETQMTALDLSQLFYIFQRPNWVHRRYMSMHYRKYFWGSMWNIILRRPFDVPEPFYQWNLNMERTDDRSTR